MRNPAGLNIYVYGCTTGEFLGSYFYKFINLDVCLPHYLKWHRVLKRKWGLGTTGAKKKKKHKKCRLSPWTILWDLILLRRLCHSFKLSFSRTLHLLIHLLLYSLILLSMVRTSQTDTHSWFTWLSMMTIIITSFTISESFIISNKVPYPNLAPCFSMMPILFIQFIIPLKLRGRCQHPGVISNCSEALSHAHSWTQASFLGKNIYLDFQFCFIIITA